MRIFRDIINVCLCCMLLFCVLPLNARQKVRLWDGTDVKAKSVTLEVFAGDGDEASRRS